MRIKDLIGSCWSCRKSERWVQTSGDKSSNPSVHKCKTGILSRDAQTFISPVTSSSSPKGSQRGSRASVAKLQTFPRRLERVEELWVDLVPQRRAAAAARKRGRWSKTSAGTRPVPQTVTKTNLFIFSCSQTQICNVFQQEVASMSASLRHLDEARRCHHATLYLFF